MRERLPGCWPYCSSWRHWQPCCPPPKLHAVIRSRRFEPTDPVHSTFHVPVSTFVFVFRFMVRRSSFRVPRNRGTWNREPRTANPEPRTRTLNTNPELGTWNLELQLLLH